LASTQALKDAPAHRAKETVDLLLTEIPAFILPTLCTPDSPDLNPADNSLVSTSGASVQRCWWAVPAYPDCTGWTWPA